MSSRHLYSEACADAGCQGCKKFFRKRDRKNYTIEFCKEFGDGQSTNKGSVPADEKLILAKFFSKNERSHIIEVKLMGKSCSCRIHEAFERKVFKKELREIENLDEILNSPEGAEFRKKVTARLSELRLTGDKSR